MKTKNKMKVAMLIWLGSVLALMLILPMSEGILIGSVFFLVPGLMVFIFTILADLKVSVFLVNAEKLPAEEILTFVEGLGLTEQEAVFELLNAAACLTPSPDVLRGCVESVIETITTD